MAAPAYRATGVATLGNTTTTVTVNKPAGTISGDVLLALVTNRGANAAPSTVPSGWTLLDSAGSSTGDIMWAGLYYLVAGGSEPADYTWSGFTDSCSGGMIAVSGADTSAPFNVHTVRYNAAGATGTAGVTTTVADTLVVSGYGSYDNNSVTQNSWACTTDPALTHRLESTSSGGNDSAVGAATGTKASAGATGASSYTLSASRSTVGFLLAVAPPSSGVTGTLAATLPALTGSLTGTVPVTGTLAGQLPALTGSLTADVTVSGQIAGILPALSGSATGTVTVSAALDGTLPALTGSAAGLVTNTGTIAGTLPALTGQMVGQVTASGQIAGALPALTGQITGLIPISGALAGTLPALRGAFAATTGPGEQDITLNVGPPATAWTADRPERGWAAGDITCSWSAGSPTV
jgi:hypothetical protein